MRSMSACPLWRTRQPVTYWTPVIAAGNLAFYDGALPAVARLGGTDRGRCVIGRFAPPGGGKMTRVTRAALVASLLAIPALFQYAEAHHGAGRYDPSKNIELEGKLTRLEFVNPHSYVYFDVAGA